MAFLSFFWILVLQLCTSLAFKCGCNAQNMSKVSAILVFGDSAVDSGNNNFIRTSLFKADYPPYGINFPGRMATGRFSDGRLVPDFVASALGLKEAVPPFLQPNLSDDELSTGVCFASAGSGLDDATTALSNSIPMSKQPGYLADYIDRLTRIRGKPEAQRIVREALVMVNAGSVDFITNFYFGRTSRRFEYSVSEYQDLLLNNLQNFLKRLYDLGCRTMSVSGLPPLGSIPLIMTANSPLMLRTSIENVNSEARTYNEKLIKLLQQLQAKLPGSNILYADIYSPLIDMINNPKKYGFVETARGCCGTGLFEAGQLCNPLTPVCRDPSRYVFWDCIHPGELAYRYIAKHLANTIGHTVLKMTQLNQNVHSNTTSRMVKNVTTKHSSVTVLQ